MKGVDLRFIFTGAEEMGLLGSLMFQKRWRKRMVLEGAFLINIDSVGKKGKMKLCSSGEAAKRWLKEVHALAREKGIDLRALRFHKGIMMDHLPFSHLGISSLSLTSISTEGWHLHTPRDTFSLVQPEGLAEMERLVLALIESMATRASPPTPSSSPP
jgi:Zn-dependent M28 family amino/carboxypeptidase